MKKIDYAKLFTKRKDGCYQKFVNGKYLYSKDPEKLYQKWQEELTGEKPKTFSEAMEEWEKVHREKVSIRTWKNYQPHVDAIKAKYKETQIQEVSVQEIVSDLNRAKAEGYSATVVKSIKAIYSSFFDYCLAKGYVSYNPVASIKLPKGLQKGKRQAPTEEEMKIVMNGLDKPFGFFPFFLLCTGMRKAEALALTVNDVDLKNKEISVAKALVYISNSHPSVKQPKSEAGNRKIPIISVLEPELKRYMSSLTGQILFPANTSNRNEGGGYMTEKGFEVAWKNYCTATGLNITAHQLRHGTATLMYESKVDVYTAKTLLGHANISTTMEIYTDLREKQHQKSIKNFDKGVSKYIKKGQ